jgi:hypothetical protein
VGRCLLSITDAANHVPVFHEFFILPQAIYDWLTGVIVPLPANVTTIAGSAVSTSTAQLGVNAVQAGGTAWGSGAITAGSIASDALTAAKFAADVTTELQSGLATAAALTTVDTVVDAIQAKTDSLTFTVAGKVDANVTHVNETEVTGDGGTGTEWGPA